MYALKITGSPSIHGFPSLEKMSEAVRLSGLLRISLSAHLSI